MRKLTEADLGKTIRSGKWMEDSEAILLGVHGDCVWWWNQKYNSHGSSLNSDSWEVVEEKKDLNCPNIGRVCNDKPAEPKKEKTINQRMIEKIINNQYQFPPYAELCAYANSKVNFLIDILDEKFKELENAK